MVKNKMEAKILSIDHPPAVVPVLLISKGYVDLGKWVANVEGVATKGTEQRREHQDLDK
ncbi:hypothetical protein TSUD_246850 [Trifolium subterraneum]|uniref:Uncharacterized protein n=1 Tax=Trifolium subterraneum TaxID=3900 RepID=A0A2Z6P4V0_TRISU|nr:hypothetical protein TSUD_246850 [Trifolium subterraneum]